MNAYLISLYCLCEQFRQWKKIFKKREWISHEVWHPEIFSISGKSIFCWIYTSMCICTCKHIWKWIYPFTWRESVYSSCLKQYFFTQPILGITIELLVACKAEYNLALLPLLFIFNFRPLYSHPTSAPGRLVIPQTHKASSYLRPFIFSVSMFLQWFLYSSFFDRSPNACHSCLSFNVPSQRDLSQWLTLSIGPTQSL